jgi:hypothetical protein
VHICFVSAHQGSAFMHELLEVVADEVALAGGEVSMHTGAYPDMPPSCAYVVIPHEYFVVTPPADQPSASQRARTLGLCVEHPGNNTFEVSVDRARSLGAVMDINADSLAELRRRGVAAERFILGYSRRWDVWRGVDESERPIDITYLGTTDLRRAHVLAMQAEELSLWQTRLLIPPHEPMYRPRQDFLMGQAKLQHLATSKVLINLHRGGSRSLEWVRVLEAMCNGCVVVSERSEDYEPLVAGEDIVFAEPSRIVATASAMLRDPVRLSSMRRAAWTVCRAMDMGASARLLMDMTASLVRGIRPGTAEQASALRSPSTHPTVPEPPQPATGLPSLAPWAAGVPEPFRRLQAGLMAAVAAARHDETSVFRATRPAGAPSRIAALIPDVACDARQAARTLASLESQDSPIDAWIGRAPSPQAGAPGDALGLGSTLNALLRAGESELVLVIEAGQELFGASVRRLIDALDASPDAVAAYGFMANPSAGELWNALPWEPDRLVRRAFLSAPFVIRRGALDELGGFSEDLALSGYEYHDLWCRIADRGWNAVFVQQILGRGERPRLADNRVAAFAPEVTNDALRRSSPRLFAGAV